MTPAELAEVKARHYSDCGHCYWCDEPFPCETARVVQALEDLTRHTTFARRLRDCLTCTYAGFRNLGTIRRPRKQFARFFLASNRG